MGFEGIPRPSQINPQANALNPYTGANLARAHNASLPKIRPTQAEEGIHAMQGEERRPYPENEDEEGDKGNYFSEEEAEQVRLMAKMRGIMNFSLESGTRYEFQLNPQTGLVDLVAADSGTVILHLTPDELVSLSGKIERYAGFLTDRAG